MKTINELIKNSYYRNRIIFTFSVVAALLVISLSRISYLFVKDLYVGQISETTTRTTIMVAQEFDDNFLTILQIGKPTDLTNHLFTEKLSNYYSAGYNAEVFIFDSHLNMIISTDTSKEYYSKNYFLELNKEEILARKTGEVFVSQPFADETGEWYLWGFFRLDDYTWLGVKESASRFEEVISLSNIFWTFGIISFLVVCLLSILLAKAITNPLNSLVEFSRKIGKGNFHSKLPENLKGEIKTLAEALIRMNSELSANQKSKEQMLAQIAHEIRNPLGGMDLLANLIKEDLQEQNKSFEYVDRIISEVNSLKSLITSYLEFSRPIETKIEECSLLEICEEVNQILQNKIQDKNISLQFSCSKENILFDKLQLKQILLNMLTNSVEASPQNGLITISSFMQNGYQKISIVDNGTGISAEKIDRIFEPFYTTKNNGTGLGLAICKKLCEQNGAHISVASIHLKTEFVITKEITNE